MDDVGGSWSEWIEYAAKLGHAFERGTQAVGTDHHRHVPPGYCRLLVLIARRPHALVGIA